MPKATIWDGVVASARKGWDAAKLPEICPDCLADPEVACPRDVDAACLHCGSKRCGRHIIEHLTKVHMVSIEWRGFLK